MLNCIVLSNLVAAIVVTSATAITEPPPVFAQEPYEEARQRATEVGKIFLAHATAEWCGPCKHMDRTTYVDERLVSFMNEHVIAVQIDVDELPELAQQLAIRAMPTMIAYREGEEFERVRGYRTAEQMLEWLENVRAGVRTVPEDHSAMVANRYQSALELVRERDFDAAVDELVWLWTNLPEMDRSLSRQVRMTTLADSMKQVADEHPPARERFIKLRDETKDRLDRPRVREWQDLEDWIALNTIVSEDQVTFEWFDRVKENPRAQPTIFRLDDQLRDLLVMHDRWADLLHTWPDAYEAVEQNIWQIEFVRERMGRMTKDLPVESESAFVDDHINSMVDDLYTLAIRAYVASLAADREDLAERIVERVAGEYDSEAFRYRLVSTALRADQPREIHLSWLDGMDDPDGDVLRLIRRVRAALAVAGDSSS